jgi:hypothetical protein
MNPVTIIHSLFDEPKYSLQLTSIKYNGKTFEEGFLEDYNYIEASDLFLREIELLVNEDIEFNKNRIRIEDRIKKFEDIEWDLYQRYRYKESYIFMNELFISRTDVKGEDKEGLIEKIQEMKLEIKEAINIQRLILELQERKSKVYKRIEELGIKFC